MNTLVAILDTAEYYEYANCVLYMIGLYIAAVVTFKK